MKLSVKIGFAAALASMMSAPAAAQATNDVRCLLASNFFARAAKDEKVRKAAEANKFYFLGRLSTHLNQQQMRTQMIAEGKAINASNAGKIMDACAAQMRVVAAKVEALGKQAAPGKK
jgi:hypothetical protein